LSFYIWVDIALMVLLVIQHIVWVHAYSRIDVGVVVEGIIRDINDVRRDNSANAAEDWVDLTGRKEE